MSKHHGRAVYRVFAALIGLSMGLTYGCGSQPSQDASETAIVGGVKVSAADVITKSTVALVTPDGNVFCTGSLVARRLVVTASHCLDGYSETALYVAFGTVARSGSFARERLRVARTFTKHEGYDTEAMNQDVATRPPNDIGLISLVADAPVDYTPVAVMKLSSSVTVGETLTLAGFGLTHWLYGTTGVLRKVDVKLTKADATAKELHFGGLPGKSACMGDSGGPAFLMRAGKLVLVGVTSRGSGTCAGEGIYTDIRHFGDWVVGRAATL